MREKTAAARAGERCDLERSDPVGGNPMTPSWLNRQRYIGKRMQRLKIH